jgi:hypothetical protein
MSGVLSVILFSFLSASPARAEDEGRLTLFGHHYSVIAGASVFVPRDPLIRSIYGRTSYTPAVTLWSFETPRGLGLSWDLGGRRMDEGGRRAESVRAGVGPRFLFANNRAGVAPYLAVRGDVYVMRFDQTAWRTKPGVNVELGASLLRRAVISARYDAVPKVGDLDLSGFSARAAVKVF